MSATAPLVRDPYSVPLEDINMSDARLYEEHVAYDYFARLRAEKPVHFCPESDVGRGVVRL